MTECVHHWILNPPEGPTVEGTCKLCGEVQEFPSVSDMDLLSPSQRRQGWCVEVLENGYT